jgi:hypothetical protein
MSAIGEGICADLKGIATGKGIGKQAEGLSQRLRARLPKQVGASTRSQP